MVSMTSVASGSRPAAVGQPGVLQLHARDVAAGVLDGVVDVPRVDELEEHPASGIDTTLMPPEPWLAAGW
jgi:hypothetical protein